MPFRNPITTLSGILTLPAIQSPDYTKTLPNSTSQSLDITGWQLNNQPSEINVETLTAENLLVASESGYYRLTNVTDALRRGLPKSYQQIQGVANPIALTTSDKSITGGCVFQPLVDGGNRIAGTTSLFHVRAYGVFQNVASATAMVTMSLLIQEFDRNTIPLATTTLTPATFSRKLGNSETDTICYEWIITTDTTGYNLQLNSNTYIAAATLRARASVAGQVQAITTSSQVIVERKNSVLWTQ